jgi:hypothetical protein
LVPVAEILTVFDTLIPMVGGVWAAARSTPAAHVKTDVHKQHCNILVAFILLYLLLLVQCFEDLSLLVSMLFPEVAPCHWH